MSNSKASRPGDWDGAKADRYSALEALGLGDGVGAW